MHSEPQNISYLQLPYTGNISMLIALPRKITGMRTLEQEISPTVVSKWLKNMTNRSAGLSLWIKLLWALENTNTITKSSGTSIFNIAELSDVRTREVVLPRFKLEQSYDLIENLEELGLTDLFKDSGDFSEMTSEKVSMNWVSLFFPLSPALMESVWRSCLMFCLHSWNTREPSQWMRRGQRLLPWHRWASCPSPLRSASLWTIPSSSWSMNTVQIA